VRVNAIAPGFIETEPGARDRRPGADPEAAMRTRRGHARHPARRPARGDRRGRRLTLAASFMTGSA